MKWFYLSSEDGNIHYIGEYETIDDADDKLYNDGIVDAVWLFNENTAQQWVNKLMVHLT